MTDAELRAIPPTPGASLIGLAAVAFAVEELLAGACEVGGPNCGPWVRKYLQPAGLLEGNAWCAGMVCWCYRQAAGPRAMPFPYTAGVRALFAECRDREFTRALGRVPVPGDLMFWTRSHNPVLGHVGIVHHADADGAVVTIEGNKSDRVMVCEYNRDRLTDFLGYAHIPDCEAADV